MLAKMLAVLFVMTATVTLGVLTMIYGWGLTPESWWWIIGVGFGGQLVLSGLTVLLK